MTNDKALIARLRGVPGSVDYNEVCRVAVEAADRLESIMHVWLVWQTDADPYTAPNLVGAFASKESAERAKATTEERGYPVQIEQIEVQP